MIKNGIHLSLLPQYKIYATKFLENKNLKKEIMYNDDNLEVVIDVDTKNTLCIEEICEEVTNVIVDIIKNKFLKEYILKNYSDVVKYDEEKVHVCSINIFNQKESFIRYAVFNRVYNYILNNHYLNLDGFVKFRMKEFIEYISVIGDVAVEEYLLKKDQDEFIGVLKYFIDVQEEKIDLLRVHITDNKLFILYDKYGNEIKNISNDEIINMVIQENLNYEDYLISTLLTLCPKKIEILDSLKNNSSIEVIEIIKSIFGDRVKIIVPS